MRSSPVRRWSVHEAKTQGADSEPMKRAAHLIGGGLLGVAGCLAYFAAGASALGIHLYVTWYAYESFGFLAAVVTFCLPGFSEVFWAIPIARAAGSWWNMYTAAMALMVVSYIVAMCVFGFIGRREQ